MKIPDVNKVEWELENTLRVALSAAKDESATRIEIVRYIEKALNLLDTLKSI
jgi:hypothetical protein